MYRCTIPLILFLCLLASALSAQAADNQQAQLRNSLGSGPLAFTKNMGQWPDSILFRSSSGSTTMWLTRNGIYYQFARPIEASELSATSGLSMPRSRTGRNPDSSGKHDQRGSLEIAMIKAEFVGASDSVEVIGHDQLEHKSHYFLGNDPDNWHSDVPSFSAVTFKNIYPGVDVSFRGENGRLEYEQVAASQAALGQVQVEYLGAVAVVRRNDGTALLQTRVGERTFAGMVPASSTSTTPSEAAAIVSAPDGLSLLYSTYLGGGTPEVASGIAIDTFGNAYVTGWTYSTDFPRLNPYDNTLAGTDDVFVTKLNAAGNGLVYSTYLGGSGLDDAWGIAIDAVGSVYLTGETGSPDFPTHNALDNSLGGDWDAFVTKLSPTGKTLAYSTYLGGSDIDLAFGIAVSAATNAYITGQTRSADFPSLNAYDNSLGGIIDGFVAKFSTAGTSLVFSTYLGGDDADSSYAICVNEIGDAYVTGVTNSTNFPVKDGLQSNLAGGSDLFVTKLVSAGNTLDYSTYLGGADDDVGYAIAYGGSDHVHVTGRTSSTNFPTHASSGQPYQTTLKGEVDAFVVDIFHTSSGPTHQTALAYSTYLGGGLVDRGLGIAKKGSNVYVTGFTYSDNFPTLAPFQTDQTGQDAFVTKLAPDGKSLVYSTYLGGNGIEWGFSVTVDNAGSAYVTGYTSSTNYPTRTPYQIDQGSYDAFVTKLSPTIFCCVGTRGNVNNSGIIDLSDLSLLIAYLTQTPRPTLPCLDAANVNAAGIIDLTDLSLLIAYLTQTPRPTLPNCP